MNVRLGWITAASLFAASVVLAFAGLWLLAVFTLFGPVYLAGRWDRLRDRHTAFVLLRSELEWARGRIVALEDERAVWWKPTHPGPAGSAPAARPDWSARNRNSNARDASPSHTTT
jgi:hypothetical protein